MAEVSLQTLIETGAHYGHQSKRWNPKMEPYIYGVQEGVHVFDLIKTKKALDEALKIITDTSSAGGKILLLGTKKQAKDKVKEIALDAGINFVSERWLGGTFTNFGQIDKSLRKLTDMRKDIEEGEYKDRTKKEKLLIEREIARLDRFFGGLMGLEGMPDILVIIDVKREKSAVKEAKMKGVKTIGIVDSNADPEVVDYPIPMNDDATKALEYVLELIKDAVLEGKKKVSAPKKTTAKKKTKKK